jgi:hypothetical protein
MGIERTVEGRKSMRRGMWIGVLVLVVVASIAVGISAYNWGLHEGLERAGEGTEVVRVVGPGFGFPFGLILFPLFIFGIFALLRGAFWGRRWRDHDYPRSFGPWRGGPEMFEDWHRRQHETGSGDHPGSGGEPATV